MTERCNSDFDYEPIPGLPEKLPEGERVLWSGVPTFWGIAMDVFHVRAVALYGALIVVWRAVATLYDGGGALAALANAGLLTGVFATGVGILSLLALMTARTTRYTITSQRVVMRIGVALTMSVNLPFKQVEKVDYRPAPAGTGAVALTMEASGGLGYLVLWPHVRPFKMARPQPMLRGIRDGEQVARLLANAIIASRGTTAAISIASREPAPVATGERAAA